MEAIFQRHLIVAEKVLGEKPRSVTYRYGYLEGLLLLASLFVAFLLSPPREYCFCQEQVRNQQLLSVVEGAGTSSCAEPSGPFHRPHFTDFRW